MTLVKTNPLKILANDPTSFILHAQPKVGKTRLAGSFPGPAFVSCPGDEALTLAGLPGAADIDIYQVDTWDDVCKALLGLSKITRTDKVQTVIFDTISFAYELTVEKVRSEQKRPEIVSQATWTEANRRMLELLDNAKRACYTTGKNFVVIGHSTDKNVGTEENPVIKVDLALGNSLLSKVCGRFNSIFHLRMIGVNKRELLMKPTAGINVGSRYNFDKNLIDPTGPDIIQMIHEYKAKVEANG